MRIKKGFVNRNVCGENIIVAEGMENIDFSKVISLNSTAAELWEAVKEKDFTDDDLVEIILNKYDIDRETASKDVASLTRKWASIGIIEGNEGELPTGEPSLEYIADRDNTTAKINTNGNTIEKKRKGFLGKLFGK